MFVVGVIVGISIVGFYMIGEACHQASQMKKRKPNGDIPEDRP